MSVEAVKEALRHGPMSSLELAQMLGRSQVFVRKRLRILRDKKSVYISVYERAPEGKAGPFVPYYSLGRKTDVPRPKPITKTEMHARNWRRYKALIQARRRPHIRESMGPWAGLGVRE